MRKNRFDFISVWKIILCTSFVLTTIAKADEKSPPTHTSITITDPNLAMKAGDNSPFAVRNGDRGSLTEQGVKAARERLTLTPSGTDIVTVEEYDTRFAQSAADVFRYTPGVMAESRYAEEVRLSIRGSGLGRSFHLRGIDLYQDGIPYNLADNSGDFQEIDPLLTRYTEVYRGGEAFALGGTSLGGAINFVSPTGHTASDRRSVRLEGGSFDTYRGNATAAETWEGGDMFVGATGISAHGFRPQSEQTTSRFSGNSGFELNSNLETRFYLSAQDVDQEAPGGLPLEQALRNGRSTNAGNIAGNYARDVSSVRFSNKTTYTPDSATTVNAGAFVLSKDLYHPIFQVIDQEYLNYGVFANSAHHHNLWGLRQETTVGINARIGDTNAQQFINVGGARGALTAQSDQDAAHYDMFVENTTWANNAVGVVAGAKLLHDTRDFTNALVPENSADVDYTRIAPKAGLLWKHSPEMLTFTSVSRSYETPTYVELVQFPVAGFVPLDPQRAWTFEAGTRATVGDLSWDVVAYRAWVQGELLNYTVDQAIPASTFNAGDTTHQGIEAGVGVKLAELLKDTSVPWLPGLPQSAIRLAYTLNDFSFEDDSQYGNNQIPGVPDHVLKAEFVIRATESFFVAPSIDWAPVGAYVDYNNTARVPGYAVLNVNADWDIAEGVSLFVDGRNLTDRQYVSNFGNLIDSSTKETSGAFYPGQPRSVFGGLKVGF